MEQDALSKDKTADSGTQTSNPLVTGQPALPLSRGHPTHTKHNALKEDKINFF